MNARIAELLRAATVEVYEKNSPRVLDSYFKPGADIYVSYLPGDDFGERIKIARILHEAGYNPVLHLPARQIMNRQMLSDYVGGANAAGVKRLLLIAGDSTRARGDYATSLQVIESGVLQTSGITHVDVAGHPEGNVGLSQERLMKVLLAPVVSEKGTFVGEKNNQYLFRVVTDATKPEIKAAVELMFSTKDNKIEVVSVQVSNVLGKEKRFGRFMGRRKDWKKAYVRLKAGQEINFVAGEAK